MHGYGELSSDTQWLNGLSLAVNRELRTGGVNDYLQSEGNDRANRSWVAVADCGANRSSDLMPEDQFAIGEARSPVT